MSEEKKTSKKLLQEITANSYEEARQAKREGRLVAWASSVAPIELCTAMDIPVIYPENHAAAEGARGGGQDLIDAAEHKGYYSDNCSYSRINLGYMEIQKAVGEEIPLPDVVFVCPNICHTLIKWYENIAYQLNIPMILIDTPFNHERDVTEENVQYVKGCLEDAIKVLEDLTGKPFNYEKLKEAMTYSNASLKKWLQALEYANNVPSPVNGFDFLNYMAAIVTSRGKKECVDMMDLWLSELEERKQAGTSVYKEGEQFRIMWDGLACWSQLRYTSKTLRENGALMVSSNYTYNWNQQFIPGDLESFARAYTSFITNLQPVNQIKSRANIIKSSHADGVLYHINRSCKLTSLVLPEFARQVQAETGVPYVMFDGDQTDKRVLSAGQFETRLQALTEIMEQRKEAQGNE